MRTQMWALLAAGLVCSGATARADDLFPPPWQRGGPLTTSAEWDFLSPEPSFAPNWYYPDGTSVPLVVGDGGNGDQFAPPTSFGGPFGLTWQSANGAGQWVSDSDGNGMFFYIPNWIDTQPIKHLRMQITYNQLSGTNSPSIIGLFADDPLGTNVVPGPITTTPLGGTRFQRLEQWDIIPNPDRERITLLVPSGIAIDQIVIDTISVPEPSTLALAGLAAATALCCWRRRNRR